MKLLKHPQLALRRQANLPALMLISATASAAAPAPARTGDPVTIGLAASCLVLLAIVLGMASRRKAQREVVVSMGENPLAEEIVTTARDAIFVIEESGTIQATNPAAERLFGFSFSELQGKSISALIPPPTSGRRRANYIHAAEGRELHGIRKSGQRFPLDLVLSELGGPKRYSVVVRDRSERNRAEAEVEGQRRFASSLIDQLPAMLTVIDAEGRIVRFNRSCEDLTQYSEGEIRGQYLWQAMAAAADMNSEERRVREILAGEFPSRSESQWCLRDNSVHTISWAHNALRDEYGLLTHVVSTGIDVTQRNQMEESRREIASLGAAGRLAGGVAHDFNNLLTAITGYSGLAMANLDTEDPVRSDIAEIQRASDRGAALTRQLLAFSGNHPRNARPVQLNEAVESVERLVRVMAGEAIHVDLSLEEGLPRAMADRNLIEECIMHLVANAKEAMPDGGTLQIQTGLRTLNRTRLDARPPIGPGEYVTLSVVDTGRGIPPEALPHIFEPFYTTKDAPVSNGMGLAIVYGIVRQADGAIAVHSAPDYGSTFRIFLPLAPGEDSRPAAESPDMAALEGQETVLVAMESDPDRARLREALEAASYTVVEARSGLQAVEIAHKATEPIHLLLTDISFTRMTGAALAGAVSERVPDIRVLYATSLGLDEIDRRGLTPETVVRLDRTLDRRYFLQRVRLALAPSTRA